MKAGQRRDTDTSIPSRIESRFLSFPNFDQLDDWLGETLWPILVRFLLTIDVP